MGNQVPKGGRSHEDIVLGRHLEAEGWKTRRRYRPQVSSTLEDPEALGIQGFSGRYFETRGPIDHQG
jgi:hypothetical protein